MIPIDPPARMTILRWIEHFNNQQKCQKSNWSEENHRFPVDGEKSQLLIPPHATRSMKKEDLDLGIPYHPFGASSKDSSHVPIHDNKNTSGKNTKCFSTSCLFQSRMEACHMIPFSHVRFHFFMNESFTSQNLRPLGTLVLGA